MSITEVLLKLKKMPQSFFNTLEDKHTEMYSLNSSNGSVQHLYANKINKYTNSCSSVRSVFLLFQF